MVTPRAPGAPAAATWAQARGASTPHPLRKFHCSSCQPPGCAMRPRALGPNGGRWGPAGGGGGEGGGRGGGGGGGWGGGGRGGGGGAWGGSGGWRAGRPRASRTPARRPGCGRRCGRCSRGPRTPRPGGGAGG